MRRALFVIMTLALGPSVATAQNRSNWREAPFDGEQQRTAQGCAARYSEQFWFCLYIRCDKPKELALYFENAGAGVRSAFQVSVDGRDHWVSVIAPTGTGLERAERASVLPPDLLAALKTGREARIKGGGVNRGFDRVALSGAAAAIKKVEQHCGLVDF